MSTTTTGGKALAERAAAACGQAPSRCWYVDGAAVTSEPQSPRRQGSGSD